MNHYHLLEHLSDIERQTLLRQYQFAISDEMATKAMDKISIWRQFVPDTDELVLSAQESDDPLLEKLDSPLPNLVHRYPNRALWKIAPTCAVYCRFCFRKKHIGRQGKVLDTQMINAAHSYIQKRTEIEEVILSGGDPLTLSPERISHIIEPFSDIPHIHRIRIHTRIPIVSPEMVQLSWFDRLDKTGKNITIVIHINNVEEFNSKSDILLQKLRQRYLLLSQSVLLKGINDSVEALSALFNALLARHIHPYYLHHLDMAPGTSHFRLTLSEGKALYQALRTKISGIALPAYIIELPNGRKKPVMELSDDELASLDMIRECS